MSEDDKTPKRCAARADVSSGSRWRKRNPSKWKRNVEKEKRKGGLPHKIKHLQRAAKVPKTVNCLMCRFKCAQTFSEEKQKEICSTYWKLDDYRRQKDFILHCVTSSTPERRRLRQDSGTHRTDAKKYFFEQEGERIRVCQAFFLKTLCISNKVILTAFKHKSMCGSFSGEDLRGKHPPANKTIPEVIEDVKCHIESFPVVESHYSRKSTKRLYLDSKLSIAQMYHLYTDKCKNEGKMPASQITYRRIFGNEYNMSFYKPKKDRCSLCAKYDNATHEEKLRLQEQYCAHQKRKEECNTAKSIDKERATTDPSFVSATFDLQSVLQIPSSDVSLLYYSRKLCAYNFTVYECSTNTNSAYCFAWTEINGKRGSTEIGTCLFDYLTGLPEQVTEVSLFSDTCGGQNRNKHVAALLLYDVQTTHLQEIEHKFLESGHTYMEVDSMHSAIEKAKKYVPVYSMQDWLVIFRIARSKRLRNKRNEPYIVKELKYSDFYNIQQLTQLLMKNTTKDVTGATVKWLQVKCFKYSKEAPWVLQYKYEHSGEYQAIRVLGKGRAACPKQLLKAYSNPLPISVAKKNDLQKLCRSGIIPEELHGWYNNLPTSDTITDILPGPAVEDSGSDDSEDDH
ncbi:uncharacterized protein LOC134532706 [Bacillus rossius redtenbacheri]|uniref:uncharacterized protein LOC134532706 n=1 Tax=Bacillus rossius redtenbacheri TaxID=93214 RepID=UPI002FDE4015